tara:strand:- start:38305 stop:38520 length:216 start_codon:yes stop_codon:yes gene_type:complete
MQNNILTNLEIHQIDQKIEQISMKCDSLNSEIFEDSQKLARYEEILDFYLGLLNSSLKKARISESNLRLIS